MQTTQPKDRTRNGAMRTSGGIAVQNDVTGRRDGPKHKPQTTKDLKMNAPDNMKAVLGMTADTVGKDILSALVTELQLMPEPWAKMPKSKQNDIIDRLRDRVAANVKMAVHLISASGRTTVTGELEQITIKGGAKAVINVSRAAESLHQFYDAQGSDVLIVVSGHADHTAGMDQVQGDIEGEVLGLPSPDGDESEPAA